VRGSTTMNDTPVTPAELFKSLRASTAALLGYDVDHLSAEQIVRTDRAVTLRLLCDHLQAQQLHGVAIDVHEFVAASEALERMVGGNPASASPEARFGPNHRERLRQLIEKTLMAADVAEADRLADAMRREEAIQAQAAGAPVEAPPAPAPVTPAPPERPANVVAFEPKPPAHYLRENQREAWRDHFDGRATGPHPWPLPQR
jgi:hypothetical protein